MAQNDETKTAGNHFSSCAPLQASMAHEARVQMVHQPQVVLPKTVYMQTHLFEVTYILYCCCHFKGEPAWGQGTVSSPQTSSQGANTMCNISVIILMIVTIQKATGAEEEAFSCLYGPL